MQKITNFEKHVLEELRKGTHFIKKDMPGFGQLIKAQNIINKGSLNPFLTYNDKPYIVTTQNQRYIDKALQKNADSACIILGSGDTLFELASRNVNKIVAFDINELQAQVYKLRRASILTLSAKDFENFLININSPKFMSPDIFRTVKNGFEKHDLEGINFWEHFLSINQKNDLIDYFFKAVGGDVGKTTYSLPYLKNKSAYYELRGKLEKVKIIIKLQDVLDYLTNNLQDKFDYIDITNILLFTYQLQCENDKEKFIEKLKMLRTIYENNLNIGGTFVLDYLFGVHINDLNKGDSINELYQSVQDIYKLTYEQLNKMFTIETFNTEKLIDGFGDKTDTLVLTKK